MNLRILSSIVLISVGLSYSHAQVGINTMDPDPSSILDVFATDKGFLPPRLTQVQMNAIVNPAEGLMVYCTDCDPKCTYVYNGVNFTDLCSSNGSNDATLLADCNSNGITGTFVSGTAANGTFSLTLTNNSFYTVVLSLAAGDLNLSGISGLSVGSPSPNSVTLTSGQSQIISYPITGTPSSIGELTATWSKLSLSCTHVFSVLSASDNVLAQIGNEGDDPDVVNSVVTVAQLNTITPTLTDVITANETAYQDYIDANPNEFSSPATQQEVQTMINNMNVLANIGTDAAAGNNNNTGTITAAQLNALPSVSGATSADEAYYKLYIANNLGNFSNPATIGQVQEMIDYYNSRTGTDVVALNGRIWMDRNLGATQVATSSTDAASYGDLYQWGRPADGHENRNSALHDGTSVRPNTITESGVWDGKFITIPDGTNRNDWVNNQTDNAWNTGTEQAPIKTATDPCPSGYRVPTEAELNAERLTWSSNNAAGAFASPLKWPAAGYRHRTNGSLYAVGSGGYYWSSTVSGTNARLLYFSSSVADMITRYRALGYSVRCLKD